MHRCNDIWTREGLQTVLGHSFRIGGATKLLLSRVDPWIVMKQGQGGGGNKIPDRGGGGRGGGVLTLNTIPNFLI